MNLQLYATNITQPSPSLRIFIICAPLYVSAVRLVGTSASNMRANKYVNVCVSQLMFCRLFFNRVKTFGMYFKCVHSNDSEL